MTTRKLASTPRFGLADLTIATMLIYVAALLTMHVIRSDVDPIGEITSAYMSGSGSVLFLGALALLGLGQIALIVGLRRALSPSVALTAGLLLLSLWTLGTFFAILVPMDAPGTAATVAGRIAELNGPLHILALALAAPLISWGFTYDPEWRSLRTPALTLGLLMPPLFVLTAATLAAEVGVAGLVQRVFMAIGLVWFAIVAVHLRRRSI